MEVWTRSLDKAGLFPIARTILGMANRLPAAASLACEGLGYIVVGAEPGNLVGVESVDPADLDQMLEPWLGGVEGSALYAGLRRDRREEVLVVVVEAPKNGDQIYTLRKESEASDGEVFVRKPGRTDRANSSDLKALTERAASRNARTPDLEVSLVGDVPLSWFDPTTIDGIVAAWVGDRRRAMESAARSEERRRHPESGVASQAPELGSIASAMADYPRERQQFAQMASDAARLASLAGFADEPDKRTLEEYLAEVETWVERATDAGPAVLVDRYLRKGHGLVAVRVHNPSGRYLPKVMVEVHFASGSRLVPGAGVHGETAPSGTAPVRRADSVHACRGRSRSRPRSTHPRSLRPTPRLSLRGAGPKMVQ